MMSRKLLKLLVVSMSLSSLAAFAQSPPSNNPAGPGCGDPSAKFEVKTGDSQLTAQPEAGKALIYVIENDSNFSSFPKPTIRAGLDGKWVGATHSNSYLYFSVDPGEHHHCSSWQMGVILGKGKQTAAAHFTAQVGGVYYFEVKNVFFRSETSAMTDTTLTALDSDEGQVLARQSHFSTSQLKK
jgi:hypothetical protein